MQKTVCFLPNYNSQVYKPSKIRKVIENTSFYKCSFILQRFLEGLKNKADI